MYHDLPLVDEQGIPFRYALPAPAIQMLHAVDQQIGNGSVGNDQLTGASTRDTYRFASIVEEAITSSQLEGASTTRRVAKAMIQEGREPGTRSERMIANNYEAMLLIHQQTDEPLTPEIVLDLQRRLTEETLDTEDAGGRFRRDDEHIVVSDETGTLLHSPPPADQLAERMIAMCQFANGHEGDAFIPPTARAIMLHFWLAYDHPFVDGNGRTARALFYWAMARRGYRLCEYVSISRILRRARAQYARAYLYTETDDNDVTYFLLQQLRVLLRGIDDLKVFLARKREELRVAETVVLRAESVHGNLNVRQLALLTHALKAPHAVYTVESHRVSHGVSYETARSDLLKLVAEQLLTKSKRSRAFLFRPSDSIRSRLSLDA